MQNAGSRPASGQGFCFSCLGDPAVLHEDTAVCKSCDSRNLLNTGVQQKSVGRIFPGDSVVEFDAVTVLVNKNDDLKANRDQGGKVRLHVTIFSPGSQVPCTSSSGSTTSSASQSVPESELWQYLMQHGHGTLAISSLQQGMQHFVLPGVGYIAYGMTSKNVFGEQRAVALGNPVCDPQQYGTMAAAFLKEFPKATFLMASESFAKVLSTEQGMLLNSIGGETEIDLATYQFTGAAKRGLRSAISSAVKSGITVAEVMQAPLMVHSTDCKDAGGVPRSSASSSDWSSVAAEMAELDRAWISKKGKHSGDVWFINRAAVHRPEPGVRKFIARDASGQLQAYVFFDAMYDGCAVVGYYANVTRMRPGAHPGVINLLIKEFIDRVRIENNVAAPAKRVSIKRSQRKKMQQAVHTPSPPAGPAVDVAAGKNSNSSSCGSGSGGVRFLSLGLSPLHAMDDSLFPHSLIAAKIFSFAYKHGSSIYPYPFQSLAAGKAKYGAGGCTAVRYNQAYMAHRFSSTPAMVSAATDLFQFCGFYRSIPDAVATSIAYKLKGAGNKVKRNMAKGKSSASKQASNMVTAIIALHNGQNSSARQCGNSS